MKKFLIFLLPLLFISCSQMDNSSTVGLVLSGKSLRAASDIELEYNTITVSASLKGDVSQHIQKKYRTFLKIQLLFLIVYLQEKIFMCMFP